MCKKVKNKLPSLRIRLVSLCVFFIVIALILSTSVFLFLINNVLGTYMKRDLEFALRETGNNLFNKTVLMEDTLLRIRQDTALMSALSGDGLLEEKYENKLTSKALESAADLFSDKNTENLSGPFIDMVYLFDLNGILNMCTYEGQLSVTKQQMDLEYTRIYKEFLKRGNDTAIVPGTNHVNVIYTLYDAWLEAKGTVIFAMRYEAFSELLNKTNDYKNSFWLVFDEDGTAILNSSDITLSAQDALKLSSYAQANTFNVSLSVGDYLVSSRTLNMGLRCAIGVPANTLSLILYQAVLPYLFVAAGLLLLIGFLLFFLIMHLTKPLTEVANNLQKVAEKNFSVKLPTYNYEEFHTIGVTFNLMTETINYLVNDVYEKQLIAKDSEIKVLQSQINPHFMYNVLHSIALKAKLDGNEEVYKMARNFAGLTRARLSHNGDDKISIEMELQYVRFYLELQKIRFEDKLNYCINVETPELLNCLIPRLVVEMIVENAVTHGIEPKGEPGCVFVDVSQVDDSLVIIIEDDGVGFEGQDGFVQLPLIIKSNEGHGNQVALNNSYKLIHHFYGEDYGISIQSRRDVGTVVKIQIPKEKANND